MKYTVPDERQALIAVRAKLDPHNVVVGFEDDTRIRFLQHNPRVEFVVEKATGKVTEHERRKQW